MERLPEFSEGVALVFGGSGGLGSAICTTLGQMGSDVALTYNSRSGPAEEVARQIRDGGRQAHIAQLNLEDADAVQKVVDDVIAKFGHIHSVVYAAGPPLEFLYINEIKPQEWARVINGDVNGCFNVVAATLPHFRERRAGNYVALVTGAVDRSPPRDILSAAPKAAIQMFMRGVAREEGRSGVRANCVGPGWIEAGLGLSTIHDHTADYVARMARAIPLKRPGKAQDIADVTAYLLTDKSSYVTGVTIPVAGGLQLA